MITDKQLAHIMPNCSAAKRALYLPFINKAMEEFEINTPLRQAAFLAQLAHESAELRYMEEIADGSAYEGRRNLGNTQPGDGRRYKGRGPIQLTGRANYEKYGELLNLDLVNNPKQAASPEVGFRIAGLYWKLNGLNELADKGRKIVSQKVKGVSRQMPAFDAITYRINGGFNGKADRWAYYDRATRAIGSEPPETSLEPDIAEPAAGASTVDDAGNLTVTSETGKPAEAPGPVAAPAVSDESSSQKIQKVAQSAASKIMAGGLPTGGVGATILLAVMGALRNPYVIGAIILGGFILGAYLFNESKKRQSETQLKLIDAAASKEKNTVAIVPPSTSVE